MYSSTSYNAAATGGYRRQPGGATGLFLADATGHGIGPALMASQCRALIRGVVSATGDLKDAIETTNRILNQDLQPGLFLTVFLGYLDTGEHKLHYTSAGQAPLLFYRRASGDRVVADAKSMFSNVGGLV